MFDGIKPLASADQPQFPKARAFAEYCCGLSGADGLIQASAFELPKIPKLAPNVLLLGVIENGADFQIRLVGTRLVSEFIGSDPTGVKMSQVSTDDEFTRRSRHILGEVMRTKRPVLNQPGRTRLQAKNYLRLETVTFPLADETGSIIKIASLYDFIFEKQTSDA